MNRKKVKKLVAWSVLVVSVLSWYAVVAWCFDYFMPRSVALLAPAVILATAAVLTWSVTTLVEA